MLHEFLKSFNRINFDLTIAAGIRIFTKKEVAMKWVLIVVGAIVAVFALMALIGLFLPVSHQATRNADFQSSRDEVWKILTDFSAYPEWRKEVTSVTKLGERAWEEIDSHGDAIAFEAVVWEAPSKLVTRITTKDLPFGGQWVYELTENNGQCQLSITEEGEVYNPLFRFMSRFIFGHAATLETYLKNLRTRLRA